MMGLLTVYIAIAAILLLIGIMSVTTDDDPDMRQIGAIVALTSVVWPLGVLYLLGCGIVELFNLALGKK